MDINIVSSAPVVHNTKADLGNTSGSISANDAELKRSFQAVASESVAEVDNTADNTDPQKLTEVATELSEMMSMMRKGLAFKVDDNSGQPIVTVLDKDTGDVIRQMPSEEALKLAEKLSEVTGLLMKTEA